MWITTTVWMLTADGHVVRMTNRSCQQCGENHRHTWSRRRRNNSSLRTWRDPATHQHFIYAPRSQRSDSEWGVPACSTGNSGNLRSRHECWYWRWWPAAVHVPPRRYIFPYDGVEGLHKPLEIEVLYLHLSNASTSLFERGNSAFWRRRILKSIPTQG